MFSITRQAICQLRSHVNNQIGLLKTAPNSAQLAAVRLSSNRATSKKLSGKVAIVTGSTEGIGFAAAKHLAEDGAKVVVSSRKQVNVDKAVAELESLYPGQIAGTVCHVAKEEDQNKLITLTLDKFGAIDYLVSNVAVNPHFGNMMEIQESQWDKIFEVNVKAPFMLSRKIVPHLLKNKGPNKGAIVYVSSIAGYSPLSGLGAYSISKTALLALAKNMSMELASEGIRVNSVVPGVIKTKFSQALTDPGNGSEELYNSLTHAKRIGQPHELGGIVSFLCSDDASYITGENIVVAGGFHCSL